jgi:membrane protein YdbS with pleckstrin-like domain
LSDINALPNSNNEFSNNELALSRVSTEDMKLISLSPKYRQINLAWGLCFGVLLTLIFTLATNGVFFDLPEDLKAHVAWGYAFIAAITLWDLLYHYFADPIKQYVLREHDLNYQSGLVFRTLVSQPILRIQHIEIKRGPIERRAGLATLQVFSAGGVSHTFIIPGLTHETAIALRQFILDHKDLAADV